MRLRVDAQGNLPIPAQKSEAVIRHSDSEATHCLQAIRHCWGATSQSAETLCTLKDKQKLPISAEQCSHTWWSSMYSSLSRSRAMLLDMRKVLGSQLGVEEAGQSQGAVLQACMSVA